ncbi:3-oxoacyl-[acyl-carrier-protein] synthase 3 protein 3 [Streptomyces minutiscleroticus]|uniref:3-oxoacyl-[acyl-carrier-protein] synthase 3 protein 3 n=1 Tax=Streptomyces minutiscleroticus TaxID=68238 RepID=A0A918P0L0_9ACTN|nr:ketoacyl-ACP synthase III [Streptomyces minutiscleroticus]GGY10414.1 3-oxoacyl-[acyl-carrier-protein] synthase 3 protein 3 [Streptomyces minutiscleroticus]
MPNGILRTAGYVPPNVVANEQIGAWSGASEQWIEERTGILERRYAPKGVSTSDLAVGAATRLLAETTAGDVDALVVATSTPDQPQPATAVFVQARLGLTEIPAFDVNAVCSGFLYGLDLADALLCAHRTWRRVLVIGCDTYSTIMDRTDRRTVSLFGDGAGAALVGRVPDGYGIHATALTADGTTSDHVRVEGGGSRRPAATLEDPGEHFFRMNGRAVKEWALQHVPKVAHQALDEAGLSVDDIDRAVFHQGNLRLVHALGDALGIDRAKLACTAQRYGNTAAASIPLTLTESHRSRPLARGERILLASVGGGMTAGASVMTWY